MTQSRRKFIKQVVTAVGGGVIGYAAFKVAANEFPDMVWGWNEQLTMLPLEETPTGQLSEATLQTLVITAQTAIELAIEPYHYDAYFQWHAANRPGYRDLYEQFAADVNQSAQQLSGCTFNECDAAARREVLDKAFQVRNASRMGQIRYGLFERDWLRYDRYIIQEIFALFARTDARVHLGYEAWPGTPRGLDNYPYPPEG